MLAISRPLRGFLPWKLSGKSSSFSAKSSSFFAGSRPCEVLLAHRSSSVAAIIFAVDRTGEMGPKRRVRTATQPAIDTLLRKSKRGKDEAENGAEKAKAAAEENAVTPEVKEAPAMTGPRQPVSDGVNQSRVQVVRRGTAEETGGPVVYWTSRDQRSRDNWALLHAVREANRKGVPVAVVFNLVDTFLGAQARHFGFMLRGLRVLEKNLAACNIPFFLFRGKAEETIPAFLVKCNASMLVMDFSPLRIGRVWRDGICANVLPTVTIHEVDAHNVVPVWVASPKLEYGARTIRTKIHKLLLEYLVEYPDLKAPQVSWNSDPPDPIVWDELIKDVLRVGAEVPEIEWCEPGEDAGLEALYGPKNGFVTKRIKRYEYRNDPTKSDSLSGLSPYLHFGHLSAQRAALEARRRRMSSPKTVDAFLEELVIRRELSENFCYYQPNYDNIEGAWDWAKKTLRDHASDKREFIFTKEELEKGKTYDRLWNAAQLEMVHHGKMHGFMRMYWAKKILEWTPSPEEALAIAIELNDKYEIDGRDPNGYVGCMWSICGIHDQGWRERAVFGKIRFMNYEGCKRKFNVDGYIALVDRIISEVKMKKKKAAASA